MKILAVGDFHGAVPAFLAKVIQKEQPDVIISPGDFRGFSLKKEFFKRCYGKDCNLWEIIGKKKVKAAELQGDSGARKVLAFLSHLNIPFYFCSGNADRFGKGVSILYNPSGWKFYDTERFPQLVKPFEESLHSTDFKKLTFGGFDIIGYPNCNWPGLPKKSFLAGKKYTLKAKQIIGRHKLFERRLSKLFESAKNPIIFLPHNVPYGLKMSVIRDRKAHKLARGHHYGSILVRDLIRKYQPRICICGHMHENQGVAKIGKTKVVNCGFGAKGEYAIIKITPKQVRVRLRKAF